MIKGVLLDLDDTLIATKTSEFFQAYLIHLGRSAFSFADPDEFVRITLAAYSTASGSNDFTTTLHERLVPEMATRLKVSPQFLLEHFDTYYRESFSDLRDMVKARPESPDLLEFLFANGLRVVVATNPAVPETAILQRMEWGGISVHKYPFEFITALETMHFGKPRVEYFEEALQRMDLNADEVLLVGDDIENDLVGASIAGFHTYWVNDTGQPLPSQFKPSAGSGTYPTLVEQMKSGLLDDLQAPLSTYRTYIHRLRAFPAVVDTLLRRFDVRILECCPADGEWSARDIICHLRDHEIEEDRTRLKQIIAEDNPFLSANYDPWAHAATYQQKTAAEALKEFAAARTETLEWLESLPVEVWKRTARSSIFGPTDFEEVVRFTSEHDRTHYQQMLRAIDNAVKKANTAASQSGAGS
jgi:HAD superfamily hydrolase (TIGR01549 family)